MRKSFKGSNQKPDLGKEFRINEKIQAPEMMIIDEEGKNLGTINTEEAMEMAMERGLDLVEVSPKAVPPIGKFINYGSYRYQKEKMERKARANTKTAEIKTLKLSVRIGQHDLDIRVNQAVGFLTDGDKVRIELQLRGREHQHNDMARETIKKFVDDVNNLLPKHDLKTEQSIMQLGSKISTIISK